MKHTPGPWILSQNTEWPWTYYVDNADELPVIAIKLHTYCTTDTQESANARAGNETTHANARLIAAAPALLEALEGVMQWADDNGRTFKLSVASDSDVANRIRAAIRAAKGEA